MRIFIWRSSFLCSSSRNESFDKWGVIFYGVSLVYKCMLPPAKQMRSTKCIAPFDSWSQTGKYFSKTSGRFNMYKWRKGVLRMRVSFAAWILPYIFVLSSFVVQIVPNLIMLMMLLRTKIRETKLRWPAKIKFKFAGCQKSWGNQTWVGDFIWLKLSFVNSVWGRWGQGDQSCCLSQ